jgi:hypothetical protein
MLASLLPPVTVRCRHSQRSGGDRWWKMKAPWLFASLSLPLSSFSFLAAAVMGRRERAQGGKLLLDKEGVVPDSKDKCSRTSLSWVAKNGTRRWSSCSNRVALCPMTPISAQLPPNPPLVAGISLHITWTRQMESRNLQRAAKVSKSSAASSLVRGGKSP